MKNTIITVALIGGAVLLVWWFTRPAKSDMPTGTASGNGNSGKSITPTIPQATNLNTNVSAVHTTLGPLGGNCLSTCGPDAACLAACQGNTGLQSTAVVQPATLTKVAAIIKPRISF